jgi:hypothetical protein
MYQRYQNREAEMICIGAMGPAITGMSRQLQVPFEYQGIAG